LIAPPAHAQMGGGRRKEDGAEAAGSGREGLPGRARQETKIETVSGPLLIVLPLATEPIASSGPCGAGHQYLALTTTGTGLK